jgi:hypothetical protein
MTIPELYNLLSDKDFQDHETGNLFFPAYMYMYNPNEAYEINAEVSEIKDRLNRPSNYLDIMILDVFEEFINYLKQEKFGKVSKYEFYINNEANKPDAVNKALKSDSYNDRFLKFLDSKIQNHLKKADEYEVAYVIIKGFGNSFPHIRASRFMNNFEKYIKGYKLIMFYPGKATQDYYSLFGLLKDENLYRAIKLINE